MGFNLKNKTINNLFLGNTLFSFPVYGEEIVALVRNVHKFSNTTFLIDVFVIKVPDRVV